LFVRCFAHVSSFGFGFWTDSLAPLFAPNFITTSVVNPPADIKLPASSTALPMQNGHILFSRRRDDTHRVAVHRKRDASALFRTASWIKDHPFETPLRWSSKISPSAV